MVLEIARPTVASTSAPSEVARTHLKRLEDESHRDFARGARAEQGGRASSTQASKIRLPQLGAPGDAEIDEPSDGVMPKEARLVADVTLVCVAGPRSSARRAFAGALVRALAESRDVHVVVVRGGPHGELALGAAPARVVEHFVGARTVRAVRFGAGRAREAMSELARDVEGVLIVEGNVPLFAHRPALAVMVTGSETAVRACAAARAVRDRVDLEVPEGWPGLAAALAARLG